MSHPQEKGPLDVERLVFFSDAVVAIAITLLALDLKVDHRSTPMQMSDLWPMWHTFAAFCLSFLLIAAFWNVHHGFFRYIVRTDERLMGQNFTWLLFIVTLPFATTLISEGLRDGVAMLIYAVNTLALTILQNNIWDYASARPQLMREHVPEEVVRDNRIGCNIAMLNSALAVVTAYFLPLVAFFILCFRPAMIFVVVRRYREQRKKMPSAR